MDPTVLQEMANITEAITYGEPYQGVLKKTEKNLAY